MENPSEERKIIHIDMDAFYASVEQMDYPELKGKPVVVGGTRQRGVVAAASYEARKFGVKSAMPGATAARLCPDLIFVRPRFDRYQEISLQIRAIFYEYTDLVEPLSLDEAFLDVTSNKKGLKSATLLAQEIRQRIWEEIGLTASAGISINKFTAKIASDVNKPNGQLTVPPNEIESFLEKLLVDRFFGIGKVTATKMKELGVRTGKDLKGKSLAFLVQHFGKLGRQYYNIVRGIQHSAVKPNRERKSLAVEHTYGSDLHSKRVVLEKLERIAEELELRLEKRQLGGKTLTLKIKFSDFSQITRSYTRESDMRTAADILPAVEGLVAGNEWEKPIRLLGLSLSKFSIMDDLKEELQLTLQF
ncbi:DNA polymerase IV [Fluviicola sp.]|jgi:DNA polymerase-4|uniref:DNA polymerase IV n=1 Tax=Fluviicola sp. TaxID=1917219 RepID=UPI00282929ED|nr:DNA polymerase IV [Fluviicola sp.]MDR0801014.1 DNA polymerase IV [Fluviicola sp.]